MSNRQRAVAFLRETYRHRIDRVETYAWSELLVTPSLARVYDALSCCTQLLRPG